PPLERRDAEGSRENRFRSSVHRAADREPSGRDAAERTGSSAWVNTSPRRRRRLLRLLARNANRRSIGHAPIAPTFEHVFHGVVNDHLRRALRSAGLQFVSALLELGDRVGREA